MIDASDHAIVCVRGARSGVPLGRRRVVTWRDVTLMRVDRRLLNWGLFFIMLGAVPLAVREGVVSQGMVGRAWTLWPVLLIAAGAGLLLRRTPLEFAGGLVAAGLLGVILGGVLATGAVPFSSCGGDRGGTAFPEASGELATGAAVQVELNCGELTIRSASGSAWRLDGLDVDGRAPEVDAAADHLTVRPRHSGGPFDALNQREQWNLTVPGSSNLDFDLTLNAGKGTVDLSGAVIDQLAVVLNAGEIHLALAETSSLGDLDVHLNAGSAKIALPNRSLSGSLSVNAGSIAFCVPAGAGLRLTTNGNITAGNNFASQGLTKSGDTWETAGFATSAVQIDLDADANAGSFTLNPNGGCGA